MTSLAARQDIILEKLKELKDQLVTMKNNSRVCAKPAQNPVNKSAGKKGAAAAVLAPPKGRCKPKVNVRDVVINCNPEHLPLSFPLLQKLWNDNLHLVFSFHTHSSVTKVPQEAVTFQKQVEQESENKENDVVFKIIWKSCNSNPEMIISPIDHVPIHSEVNILRFLSRVGPDFYNFEAQPNVNELDKIFDVCFKLSNIETEGERAQLIDLLVKHLGQSLAATELKEVSLVDLAIYSTLSNNKKSLPKAHAQKITKWCKMVETTCAK